GIALALLAADEQIAPARGFFAYAAASDHRRFEPRRIEPSLDDDEGVRSRPSVGRGERRERQEIHVLFRAQTGFVQKLCGFTAHRHFVRFGKEFPGQGARPQRVEMDHPHRYSVRGNERKSLVGSAGSSRSRGQEQTQDDSRDRKREISRESHFQKSFLEKSQAARPSATSPKRPVDPKTASRSISPKWRKLPPPDTSATVARPSSAVFGKIQ